MGKTIMISSHILSELETMCDHVGIIERGHLIFSGDLDQIRQRMGLQSKVRVQVAGEMDKAAAALAALPQVRDVKQADDHLAVTFRDDEGTDGLIARTLVQAGIDLVALIPEQLNLDDAFLHLTQGMVH